MLTETFYSADIAYLEKLVDDFSDGKIIFDVSYDRTAYGWTAMVWYLPL